jgi:O-antigen ligase
MEEGLDTFLERPLTGVGAGQFKNYNPPWRKERWRETHNALLQVAADTGIFGLAAFLFLILRGAMVAASTRRLLSRPRKRTPDPLRFTLSDVDRESLYAYAAAMTAGLVGWFICALFASVAYSWTFYYLLALIVAPRELARVRLAAAHAFQNRSVSARPLPSERFSPERVTGAA